MTTGEERQAAYERRVPIVAALRALAAAHPGGLLVNEQEGVWWEGLYQNGNGFAVAIVASVNAVDWAAYIGGTEGIHTTETETIEWVARHGCKLEEAHARHFFDDVLGRADLADLPYRP